MSEIINLDDQRPHVTRYVACISCGKDWVATVDARAEGMLECPECGALAGDVVSTTDTDFFQRFTGAAKGKKDQRKRTLVLLNAQRMGL